MASTDRAGALHALHAVSQRVSAAADLDAMLAAVLSGLADLVPCESASIMLLDSSGETLVVRAAKDKKGVGMRVPSGPSISWQAIQRREPIVVEGRAASDLGTAYTKDVPVSVCVPLLVGPSAVGVMNANSHGPGFSEDDIVILQVLADHAAFAIERVELYGNLQHFTGQLMSAEEEQRRRLARDLHDGIAPILVSAYQNLQLHYSTVPEEKRDIRLEKAVAHLKKAIQETRGLIAGLRPATLDDLGLAAALAAEAREMAREADWQLEVDVEDPGPVGVEAEATLFRVLHEALENVKSHAEARRVRFSLKRDGEDLVAVVADDGRGFLPSDWLEAGAHGGHFGLLGMRERIGLLGGECKVTSRPGAGTQVRVRVPAKRLKG